MCARPTMLSVTEQASSEAYTTRPLRARGQRRQLVAGWPEPHRGHQGYHRSASRGPGSWVKQPRLEVEPGNASARGTRVRHMMARPSQCSARAVARAVLYRRSISNLYTIHSSLEC